MLSLSPPSNTLTCVTQFNRTPPVLVPAPPKLQISPNTSNTLQRQNMPPPLQQRQNMPPPLQHMGSPGSTSSINSAVKPTQTTTQNVHNLQQNFIPQNDGIDNAEFSEGDQEEFLPSDEFDEIGAEGVKKPKKKYIKQKKLTAEAVFNEIENSYIRRGRARPDHNDQGKIFILFLVCF